jgi:hypothetical protein
LNIKELQNNKGDHAASQPKIILAVKTQLMIFASLTTFVATVYFKVRTTLISYRNGRWTTDLKK